MIRLLILLTTLFLVISCENQISSNKSKVPEQIATENPILELQVELIPNLDTLKVLKQLVYCGTLKVEITLNFKVIKVISGKYKHKNIRINISCPLEAINNHSLENNKIYTFRLKRRQLVTNLNNGETTDAGDFEIITKTD